MTVQWSGRPVKKDRLQVLNTARLRDLVLNRYRANREEAVAKDTRATIDAELLEVMLASDKKTVKFELEEENVTVQTTVVQFEPKEVLSEEALLTAIGRDRYHALCTRTVQFVLDQDKLLAAITSGQITKQEIKACTKQEVRNPYLRHTPNAKTT